MSTKTKASLTKTDMAGLRRAASIVAPVFAANGWVWGLCDQQVPGEAEIMAHLVSCAESVASDKDLISTGSGRIVVRRTDLGLAVYLGVANLFGRKWEMPNADPQSLP